MYKKIIALLALFVLAANVNSQVLSITKTDRPLQNPYYGILIWQSTVPSTQAIFGGQGLTSGYESAEDIQLVENGTSSDLVTGFSFIYSYNSDLREGERQTGPLNVRFYENELQADGTNIPKAEPFATYNFEAPLTNNQNFSIVWKNLVVEIQTIKVPRKFWISVEPDTDPEGKDGYGFVIGIRRDPNYLPQLGTTDTLTHAYRSAFNMNPNWFLNDFFDLNHSFPYTLWRRECVADVNRDGIVNISDLSILLNNFNQNVVFMENGDLNGDSLVNNADLSICLNSFSCVAQFNN